MQFEVIATSGPDRYLVTLTVTTSAQVSVAAADATDAILSGYKVISPDAPPPAPLPAAPAGVAPAATPAAVPAAPAAAPAPGLAGSTPVNHLLNLPR